MDPLLDRFEPIISLSSTAAAVSKVIFPRPEGLYVFVLGAVERSSMIKWASAEGVVAVVAGDGNGPLCEVAAELPAVAP